MEPKAHVVRRLSTLFFFVALVAPHTGYTGSPPAPQSFSNLNSNQIHEHFSGSRRGSGGDADENRPVPRPRPRPTVSITAPAMNVTFRAPATITLGATASDPERTVTHVSFRANSKTLGTANASPYSYTWTNVAAGTYTLTATARFDRGLPATSVPIRIRVKAPAAGPPQVVVVSPAVGTSYAAPARVIVRASATAPAGLRRIDFFAGSTLIGTGTSTTSSISWSNVVAGRYSLTAVATDAAGATAYSAPVAVTVMPGATTTPPPPPSPLAATPGLDPTGWPLIQPGNLAYVGAFRLPASSNNGAFDFGGAPMTFNPANNSLFVGNYRGQIAEVNIPTPVSSGAVGDLPFAGYVQGFRDPVEGHLTDVASSGAGLYGLMVSGDSLYGTAAVYYDANNTQSVSHYRRSTSLSTSSFSGFTSLWQPTSTDIDNGVPGLATGYASGYMAAVPSAWQPLLGGSAISGQWGLPIIMRESYGPDAIVWDPGQLGSVNGKSLLYYTNRHPTLGPYASSSSIWGGAATSGGLALIDGTRTALFFGRNGLGTFCYGEGTADRSLAGTVNPADGAEYCYDPASAAKGSHAYPYVYQVWAYDLNDLAAVKSGSRQPWQVVPYATWTLNLPTTDASFKGIGGVGYDPARQLVYVSQLRADRDTYAYRAVIHVFAIR